MALLCDLQIVELAACFDHLHRASRQDDYYNQSFQGVGRKSWLLRGAASICKDALSFNQFS